MKLRKNPLGEYVGKIGNTVGGKWKSVYWVRTLVYPTQRGTLELYYLLKQGLISPEKFSFKQMNIRRLSLSPLGWVAENNLASLIYPVWERLARRKHLSKSGVNLFVKANARTLFTSMPHIDQEFDPTTNSPDIKKILMSDGILEPINTIVGGHYDTANGKVSVQWNSTCFTNGQPDDYAYIVVLKRPILEGYGPDGNWKPALFMYGEAKLPEPPATPRERQNGDMDITIPIGLQATDLVAFLFFKDKKNELGFSPSKAWQLEAA